MDCSFADFILKDTRTILKFTLFIVTLLLMAILITLIKGDITYDHTGDITYNDNTTLINATLLMCFNYCYK